MIKLKKQNNAMTELEKNYEKRSFINIAIPIPPSMIVITLAMVSNEGNDIENTINVIEKESLLS